VTTDRQADRQTQHNATTNTALAKRRVGESDLKYFSLKTNRKQIRKENNNHLLSNKYVGLLTVGPKFTLAASHAASW